MTNWNKLLLVLDQTLGLMNNKSTSKVMKRGQAYDNDTHEHVIWLEYRVKVRNDVPEPTLEHYGIRETGILKQLLNAIDRRKTAVHDRSRCSTMTSIPWFQQRGNGREIQTEFHSSGTL